MIDTRRDTWGTLLFAFPVAVLLAMLYFPVFRDMASVWWRDANYSHSFLIPIVSGYFFWHRRGRIKECSLKPWSAGILLVIAGIGSYTIGSIGVAHTTMRLSFFVLCSGIITFLFGLDLFMVLLFPFLYLLFMVPLPAYLYDAIAFPLKKFITAVSVNFLKALEYPVLRDGNMIIFPNFRLEVADACSGVRSIYSMLALSVTYGEIVNLRRWRKFALALSVIPIAVVANAMRVIGSAVVAKYFDPDYVRGTLHEFAGLAVFLTMAVLLFLLGGCLKSGGSGRP